MKCLQVFTGLFLVSISAHASQNGTGHTLKEAYQAALIRSESIGVQKELLTQVNESEVQGGGAFFPTISGSGTFVNQANPNNAAGATFYPTSQSTMKVTASQPLFRGLRDFATLRQRKTQVGVQFQALQNAARQLFYDVSTAFHNYLTLTHDVENYQAEIEINQRRLKELQNFFKIGRAQLTDLLTLQANIASLEAQLENSRGQLEVSKEVLAYLTGWNREVKLKDELTPPDVKMDVSIYLEKLEQRADILYAKANVKAYEEGIPISFGQHLPSADLLGNYYFARPGALSEVNWDISLVLTIPIFQGGIIQSQVRQAESVVRQYQLNLSQARRLGEQEIRSFHDQVLADLKQVKKLEELVEISKKNYETEVQYFRNGLVTNLDVLNATNTYRDARRQLDRQLETSQLDFSKLQAATGEREEIHVDAL